MIPKFRTYFNKYKRMIYGVGLVNENSILVDFNGEGSCEYMFLTNDIKLMQYTGLKDKNGVEIYEGDILKSKLKEPIIVGFRDGSFSVKYKRSENVNVSTTLSCFLDKYKAKIVGNIYENAELLKEEEDD